MEARAAIRSSSSNRADRAGVAEPALTPKSQADPTRARTSFWRTARVRPPKSQRWREPMDPRTQNIRALNDQLRRHLAGGLAVITPGIAALGPETVKRIIQTIATFDDFCH